MAKLKKKSTSTASQALAARYLTEFASEALTTHRKEFIRLQKTIFGEGESEQAWDDAILDEADRIRTRMARDLAETAR